MTRLFLLAGFIVLALHAIQTGGLIDAMQAAEWSRSAADWKERAQRLPTPRWSAPDRTSLSIAGGAVTFESGHARVVQRFALSTRSPVTAVAEKAGTVVFGTLDEGLFRIAPGATEALHQPLDVDPRINDLAFDDDGALFIATQGGAFQVALDGTTLRLAPGAFAAVAAWRGQPWFVSRRGLSTVDARGFWTRGPEQGIAADSPAAVAACGELLCIGALDGLWLFDGRSTVHRSSAAGDLPADWVTAAAWNGNAIWAATFDAGISRLSGSSVRRFGGGDGLPEARVGPRALAVEGATAYAGTPGGVLVLRDDRAMLVRDGLPEADVTALARSESGPGELWVGYRGGLSRIQLGAMP